jgi:putative flippase GtrA
LTPLVDELLEAGFGAVILVEDGAPAADRPGFDALAARERVYLARHAVNCGKGRALKTGLHVFLNSMPGFDGLITADADGQHTAADIARVAAELCAHPQRAVLGCRRFGAGAPLRSRLGNALTRMIFHFASGRNVGDTQTGLRGFPAALLPFLAALEGERYEYEMTVLAWLCRQGHAPLEVPIQTIYVENNRSSGFNPARDSMRIYFVLLRYYAASLFSAGLDFAVFSLAFWIAHSILAAVIAGRVSSLVNFILNKRYVFSRAASNGGSLGRYYLLALGIAALSYVSIRSISASWHWNVLAAKAVADTLLSLASFSVQRTFVFPDVEEG